MQKDDLNKREKHGGDGAHIQLLFKSTLNQLANCLNVFLINHLYLKMIIEQKSPLRMGQPKEKKIT